jgi:L-ascorbate metabolism protein UlaG (beta-lactamase superfamily)
VHTCPEEALQAFLDLGARRMIPMHYGTFRLSQEPMDEPVERLMAAARLSGAASSVNVLPEGETDVTQPVTEPALNRRAAQA